MKKKEEEDEKDTRRNKTSEGENERKKNGGDATEAEVGNHSSMHEVTVETCNARSDTHDPGED